MLYTCIMMVYSVFVYLFVHLFIVVPVIATGGVPALLCPLLSDPRWGSVTINYNPGINTYEAEYHCEDGKSLNGDERRYCSDNTRRWSGQEPTCIPGNLIRIMLTFVCE